MFGDTKAFKRWLGRTVTSGRGLLDQARGVLELKKSVEEDGDFDAGRFLGKMVAEADWLVDLARWRARAVQSVERHLLHQAQAVVPTVVAPFPPETGKPRHERSVERMEPWLRASVDELVALLDRLGVTRNVAPAAPVPGRFAELEASGLVEPSAVAQYVRQMSTLNTPARRHYAIGAAKEITEATLRGALDRMGESWRPVDGVAFLAKKWQTAVDVMAPPDPLGEEALKKALSSLAGVITFLTEWRNQYGSGHGRPKYAPTNPRQARLAVDAAETVVRYISLTMDDLGLLPPVIE